MNAQNAAQILILGAPRPQLAPEALHALCARLETALAPRLAPEQCRHISRFSTASVAGLQQRCSRLLARALLFAGLASDRGERGVLHKAALLRADALGRPILPSRLVGFSHSGAAAFCALARLPGQQRILAASEQHALALDAEALINPPPSQRAFADGEMRPLASPAQAQREALRRWTIKEAILKASGLGLSHDPATLYAGRAGGRAGCVSLSSSALHWRLVPCPGHWLCLASSQPFLQTSPDALRFFWFTASQTQKILEDAL
ncbi:MAG: 4'-phosphopantetheinyl transferase superfamily protein [Desulfovibrio sp.]|jgi:phosphopantetheinyl transferase|nr:4'-phosphopantetheinyl transferase superfamily protein [Desulfovibrio sp.]